ncbi:MAG: hypothetical protein V4623_10910 [Pseudomonadota bacterium]
MVFSFWLDDFVRLMLGGDSIKVFTAVLRSVLHIIVVNAGKSDKNIDGW